MFFLLIAISASIFAQEDKGNIFVETGVNMFGGSEYFAFAGQTGILIQIILMKAI